MHGWGPDTVGKLTPKQLFAYTRVTPGTGKTVRVGSRAEAKNICTQLRGE